MNSVQVLKALEKTLKEFSDRSMGIEGEIVKHYANWNMFSASDESYKSIDLKEFAEKLVNNLEIPHDS